MTARSMVNASTAPVFVTRTTQLSTVLYRFIKSQTFQGKSVLITRVVEVVLGEIIISLIHAFHYYFQRNYYSVNKYRICKRSPSNKRPLRQIL